jgi:hypothetical protein
MTEYGGGMGKHKSIQADKRHIFFIGLFLQSSANTTQHITSPYNNQSTINNRIYTQQP